uniref:Uncharacterized protein n=1 Tax=Rhizophagus irregularis (strain DAOM 181602 / DAOM 197198 / MUCL 43194) TaxID=747089 RepID=U9SSL7_RHIID
MTHSNEKALKSGVINEETESLQWDYYGCNFENTKDNEISNHEIRNVQAASAKFDSKAMGTRSFYV